MQDDPGSDVLKKAKGYALRLLAIRPRSKKELKDRLRQKDFPCQVIDSLIDDFTSRGFLNDAKFAKDFITSRLNNNPKGFYLIKAELRKKGVEQDAIDEAIEEARQKTDEREVALEIARDKKRRFKDLDKEKSRRRIYDFLNRRGFSTNAIYEVMRELYDSGEDLDNG